VSSNPAGLLPCSQDYQALQVTRISLVRRAFQGAQSELSGNANVSGRGTEREPEIAGESVCTDASHDDHGGSSAHRNQQVARRGR
jgi:hypothetical protein